MLPSEAKTRGFPIRRPIRFGTNLAHAHEACSCADVPLVGRHRRRFRPFLELEATGARAEAASSFDVTTEARGKPRRYVREASRLPWGT
jgi:hypothetical protein